MISSISNIKEANDIIISRLTQNNSNFLPLDKYTHQCLTSDKFNLLKEATGVDYDEFCRGYIDSFGEPEDITNYVFTGYSISSSYSTRYLVYPYSRTSLYKDVYSDVLPSVFSVYFNLMKGIEKVRQFGTGVGKALLIEITPFVKSEFDSVRLMGYKDVVDLMVVVSEQIAKQNTDIEHLLNVVKTMTEEKQFLVNEIDRLNKLVINTSMTTWR